MSNPTKNNSTDEERALRLNQYYRDINKLVGYNRKYLNGGTSKSNNRGPLVSQNDVGIPQSVQGFSVETLHNAEHSTGKSGSTGMATGTSGNAGQSAAWSCDAAGKKVSGYFSSG